MHTGTIHFAAGLLIPTFSNIMLTTFKSRKEPLVFLSYGVSYKKAIKLVWYNPALLNCVAFYQIFHLFPWPKYERTFKAVLSLARYLAETMGYNISFSSPLHELAIFHFRCVTTDLMDVLKTLFSLSKILERKSPAFPQRECILGSWSFPCLYVLFLNNLLFCLSSIFKMMVLKKYGVKVLVWRWWKTNPYFISLGSAPKFIPCSFSI